MATITIPRHLQTLKNNTLLNVGTLSKLTPMSPELSMMLQKNSVEKPTQNFFNHLSHYLVKFIDPNVVLPWPLYDSKAERTYRNELSVFIAEYSSKGLLAPVMSSYLVNPGCYKVIILMFELSQLAVQRILQAKMDKELKIELYNEMTVKYHSEKEDCFIESIDKVMNVMLTKVSNYLNKREAMEKIVEKLDFMVTKMEDKLAAIDKLGLLNNLVDGFVEKYSLNEDAKKEVLEVKDVYKCSKFLDKCLLEIDRQIDDMESNWDTKMSGFLQAGQKTYENTKALIARQTGEADKKTFMIEYNPKTDDISTDELQKHVNSQQKYILKNLVKGDRLNFPNLIRGFLVSISFILKNAEIGDEIYQFNEYWIGGCKNYTELVSAMRTLMDRVMNAEGRLQQQQETASIIATSIDVPEIPPLPDLTGLKMNKEYNNRVMFEPFTPLNWNKHKFNLRKQKTGSFMKPMPKSLLVTPFHVPRGDFLIPKVNCTMYNNLSFISNHNLSVISQVMSRGNETIVECTSGFTKEQICRLLSTKKSSSCKKFKHKVVRPNIKIKKGGLFNESNLSDESVVLFRSHSSPNLFENRERQPRSQLRSRKLSIMKEDSTSLLEVSGFAALERDSSHSTPQGLIALESTRKLSESSSLPSISTNVTPRGDISNVLEVDLNKEISVNEFKAPLPQKNRRDTSEENILLHRKSTEMVKDSMLPLLNSIEINDPAVLPQQISKQINGKPRLSPPKSTEFYEKTVLPQQKIKKIEKEPIIKQRISREANEEQVFHNMRNKQINDEGACPQNKINNYDEEPVLPQRKSTELNQVPKSETPKTNPKIIKRTSSLEKIINRFKRVKAGALQSELPESNDFKIIFEEKENLYNCNKMFTANRNLLPDLLSPSCSVITPKANDFLDELNDSDEDKPRQSRPSLGAALGVDHTFLDQFDLID